MEIDIKLTMMRIFFLWRMKSWFRISTIFNFSFQFSKSVSYKHSNFCQKLHSSCGKKQNKLKSFRHMTREHEFELVFHMPPTIFGDIELHVTSHHPNRNHGVYASAHFKHNYHNPNWFPTGMYCLYEKFCLYLCECVYWIRRKPQMR